MKRALLFVTVVLVGCSSPTPVTPTPNASTPSPPSAVLDCSGGEIRTPSGDLLDLSGTWTGGSSTIYLRQLDHCVWWFGLSEFANQAPGECFSNTFTGRLGADNTLSGEWASIVLGGGECGGTPQSGSTEGPVTFELDFDCDGCEDVPVLRDKWYRTNDTPSPFFYTPGLRWVGELPLSQGPR